MNWLKLQKNCIAHKLYNTNYICLCHEALAEAHPQALPDPVPAQGPVPVSLLPLSSAAESSLLSNLSSLQAQAIIGWGFTIAMVNSRQGGVEKEPEIVKINQMYLLK